MAQESEVDVVVVGAGPTGSNSARLFAERGLSVLLLEEHPEVGHPVQCAGLVTPRVFDHTPFPIGDLWQNDLRGGVVYAPDGTQISFETSDVHAVAMDRARFDQRMAEAAVAAGATLRVATKATAAKRQSGRVVVTVQSTGDNGAKTTKRVHCKLLVGADGIRGSVARWFNFPPVREQVSAYEVELSGCNIPDGQEHMIPMFAGNAQAPGFFSWIIPVGNGKTRSGLAVAPGLSEQAAKRYYERMFTDPASAAYLDGSSEEYRIIGGIPLGLRRQLVQDNVALVGDAAGMAKPTSGGGILMGLLASERLVDVATPFIQAGNATARNLRPYGRWVRRTIGRELRKGELLRNLFVKFQDPDLNEFARLLQKPKAVQTIEKRGDIDYVSRLIAPLLLAQPKLIPFFAKVLLRPAPKSAVNRRKAFQS